MAKVAVRFSRHARNRLRWQRLTRADALAVLEAPDWTEPSYAGRVNHWKRVRRGWLRVSTAIERSRTIIVTVTLRDRRPKGMR